MAACHYFSHRDLYTTYLQPFLCGQKGISADIRLVGKLTPWFLFMVFLSPVILVLNPHPTPECRLSPFSHLIASSRAELALPRILVWFPADYEAYSVATASKQQAFPANLIPGLNVTSPTGCFLDQLRCCVTGMWAASQSWILVDSHLKAGVKVESEKGWQEECSQLMLISVRFQLRIVKR